jgi:diguanylate cyclase (GGDEF)-like protein
MSALLDLLCGRTGERLLAQTHTLLALMDHSGELREWSASMDERLALQPGSTRIFDLLDTSSRPRLYDQISGLRPGQQSETLMLHFASGAMDLPDSYQCSVIGLPGGDLVLLAEPLAPLDQISAQEYLRVTNDLAAATRELQRTRHDLERKQRDLEESLRWIAQLAHTDELTQLLNRRSIIERLDQELQRLRRYAAELSVVLIDVDHFKQINDRYGHPFGDHVLRIVSGLLKRALRSTDHLGRYGGEEFLAVLPMTGPAPALDLAERLRLQVERYSFVAAETVAFQVTISLGVASYSPQSATLDALVASADQALYRAKQAGRNRSLLWSPERDLRPAE